MNEFTKLTLWQIAAIILTLSVFHVAKALGAGENTLVFPCLFSLAMIFVAGIVVVTIVNSDGSTTDASNFFPIFVVFLVASIACAFSYLSIVAAVLIAVVESGEEGQIKKKWNVAILGIGALSIAHTIGLERTQGVIFASTSVVLLFLLYLIGKSRALRPAPSASPSV